MGLCCVCSNRNLRHYFREAEFEIKRPDSQASMQLPCCVTLSGSFQWFEPQLLPLERMGDASCPCGLARGVLRKTNEIMGLQEHYAAQGTIKLQMFVILPFVWFSLDLFLARASLESMCERQKHRHAQTHT